MNAYVSSPWKYGNVKGKPINVFHCRRLDQPTYPVERREKLEVEQREIFASQAK